MNQNIRLFYGPNQFACMRELSRWKAAFVAKYGDFDIEILDGKGLSSDRIIQCCDTHPFMGEKRLVIVRDFLPEASKKAQKDDIKEGDDDAELAQKDNYESIISYFEHFPDTCVLVFVSGNPDKRTRFFKALQNVGQIHEFREIKGITFARWVLDEAKELGISLEPRALDYFTLHVGEDMWKAVSELEKLALYTPDPITIRDIDTVVSSNVQVKIFAFVDALGYRDTAKAIRLFRQLLDGGENIFMVFNMIIRQFRLLLQIRALSDNGSDRKTIMSRLRLAPFQVATLIEQAKKFQFSKLVSVYKDLLALDVSLKTGKIPSSGDRQEMFVLALEHFFVCNGFS